MKKSLLMILCIFAVCTGCANSNIESKLKENGFEVDFDDKTIRLSIVEDNKYYGFSYSLADEGDENFFFAANTGEKRMSLYSIIDNDYLLGLNENDNRCYIDDKGNSGDNCTDEHMELLDEAEEKYNDFLNKLDITEKELYEYMKELYNENFI